MSLHIYLPVFEISRSLADSGVESISTLERSRRDAPKITAKLKNSLKNVATVASECPNLQYLRSIPYPTCFSGRARRAAPKITAKLKNSLKNVATVASECPILLYPTRFNL